MIKIVLLFVTELFLEAEDCLLILSWVLDSSRSDSSEEISGISSGSSTSSESSLEEGSFIISFSATGVSQGLVLDLGPGLVFDFGPGLYPLTFAPVFGGSKWFIKGFFFHFFECGSIFGTSSINMAFSQKGLMRLSFLQTDKPNYFPELEFWSFFHSKWLKSCQIRTWSCSNAFF